MSSSTEEPAVDPRVSVSDSAVEEALSLMERENMDSEVAGVRLFVQQGGCAGLSYGMRFEPEPEEEDFIVEEDGLRVFVDPASLDYIEGSRFDYEGGLQSAGFNVENPNVVSECGCGESFRT